MRHPMFILCTLLVVAMSGQAYAASGSDKSGPAGSDSLPNVLDCHVLGWMKNCTAINHSIAQNPAAPIRVYDKSGLEFDFKPGTPSPVIMYALEPSVENARNLLHYFNAQSYRAEYEAELMQKVIAQEGMPKTPFEQTPYDEYAKVGKSGSVSIRTPQVERTDKGLAVLNPNAYKKVRIFVFYDSHCQWCNKLAPQLATLHKAHPSLNISMLQLNHDPKGLEKFAMLTDLPVHELTGRGSEQLKRMVTGTPTIWLQSIGGNSTKVIPGFQTEPELESEIAEAVQ